MRFFSIAGSRVGELILMAVLAAGGLPAFATEVHQFDIPAEDASAAIRDFGAQAHVQILVAGENVKDRGLHPVSGAYSTEDGLNRLLAGSGLTHEYVGDHAIALMPVSNSNAPPQATAQAQGESSKSSPGDSLLLAQAPPGQSQGDASVEQGGEKSAEEKKSEELQQVVVTGTHIHGAPPIGSPVIEITRSDIDNSGYTSTTQLIESLPQNFGGGAPQVLGTQGPFAQEFSPYTATSSPSLRGLGDATLTLVNGHRLSLTGGSNGSDISSIPVIAIEKVEVLPDGASAIYGADAVAGVINVVLRKDYEGVEASAALSEPTQSGGGQQETYALLGGTHWTGGNLLVSYTGQNQDPLFTSDRAFSRAAANPTTLYPDSHSNAFTTYVSQDIAARSSIYLDALYSERTNSNDLAYSSPLFSFTSYSPGQSKAYAVSPGLLLHPGSDWVVGADANISSDQVSQTLWQTIGSVTSLSSSTISLDREYGIELHADGPLASLPSGPIKAAFGGGFLRETYSLTFPPPSEAAGDLSGGRNDTYAYAEFEMPLVRPETERVGFESFNVNLSGRYDHYTDFGASANPRIGLTYGAVHDVHLSGTYGRSFRAPLVTDLVSPGGGFLYSASDSRFASGSAVALYESGGNAALEPETSKSWTTTLDYTPAKIAGLTVRATYFSYDFANKITAPLPGTFMQLPLSNPFTEPFVTFFPTPAQVQTVASGLTSLFNLVGPGATLSDVEAIVNNRFQNISKWTSKGVDLLSSYRVALERGTLDFSFNGSKLLVQQIAVPGTPFETLSGIVFGPAKLRIRTGLVWSTREWSVGGFINYLSGETNPYSTPTTEIGSYTTTDVHLAYRFNSSNWLSGSQISLTALNVLDRDPPHISTDSTTYPGIGYDSTNASPFGRIITLQIVKQWGSSR
jgi:iron complex outermembrane receptor protein